VGEVLSYQLVLTLDVTFKISEVRNLHVCTL